MRYVGAFSLGLTACVSSGEMVVFDNRDLSFTWEISIWAGDLIPGTFLDITRDAALQTGDASSSAFGYYSYQSPSSTGWSDRGIFPSLQFGRHVVLGDPILVDVNDDVWFRGVKEFQLGETVGPDEDYAYSAPLLVSSRQTGTIRLVADRLVMGVSFEIGDDTHYGWIALADAGRSYQPIGWGYETEAGVPALVVAIPSPGAFGLLLGGFAVARRRR